jgi:hypothetical protein
MSSSRNYTHAKKERMKQHQHAFNYSCEHTPVATRTCVCVCLLVLIRFLTIFEATLSLLFTYDVVESELYAYGNKVRDAAVACMHVCKFRHMPILHSSEQSHVSTRMRLL